jgi:hypothetical protein
MLHQKSTQVAVEDIKLFLKLYGPFSLTLMNFLNATVVQNRACFSVVDEANISR